MDQEQSGSQPACGTGLSHVPNGRPSLWRASPRSVGAKLPVVPPATILLNTGPPRLAFGALLPACCSRGDGSPILSAPVRMLRQPVGYAPVTSPRRAVTSSLPRRAALQPLRIHFGRPASPDPILASSVPVERRSVPQAPCLPLSISPSVYRPPRVCWPIARLPPFAPLIHASRQTVSLAPS